MRGVGVMRARRSMLVKASVFVAAIFFSAPALSQIVILRNISACPSDQPETSWNNCKGSKTFADGSRYIGEFKNGTPDGGGILEFTKEWTYEGAFKDGVRNGFGIMVYANGTKYSGEFKDGKFD